MSVSGVSCVRCHSCIVFAHGLFRRVSVRRASFRYTPTANPAQTTKLLTRETSVCSCHPCQQHQKQLTSIPYLRQHTITDPLSRLKSSDTGNQGSLKAVTKYNLFLFSTTYLFSTTLPRYISRICNIKKILLQNTLLQQHTRHHNKSAKPIDVKGLDTHTRYIHWARINSG